MRYPKIQTMFKRDGKDLLIGEWSTPELEYLSGLEWEWTEKIDGTNIRIYWDGKEDVEVRGRSDNAQIPVPLLRAIEQTFTPQRFRSGFETSENEEYLPVCLYGEGCGEKIQKNGGAYGSPHFVLFDCCIGEWWIRSDDLRGVAQAMSIPIVPIIDSGTLMEAVEFTRWGFESVYSSEKRSAEGLVLRPRVQLFDRMGRIIMTKIKSKDFR